MFYSNFAEHHKLFALKFIFSNVFKAFSKIVNSEFFLRKNTFI